MGEILNIEDVARICHEANRAYCVTIGDNSQLPWNDAPEWQKESARKGVELHFSALASGIKLPASASHDAWLKEKSAQGWKYGVVKDAEKKEHPCFVAYDELPFIQRVKDYLFGGICETAWTAKLAVPGEKA